MHAIATPAAIRSTLALDLALLRAARELGDPCVIPYTAPAPIRRRVSLATCILAVSALASLVACYGAAVVR